MEEIPALEKEKEKLDKDAKLARKKLKAKGSFDGDFWTSAADVEEMYLRKTRVASEISLSKFKGPDSAWAKSEEARSLFEQIRAQEYRVRSFSAQSKALSLDDPKRTLRGSFMKFFTTSTLGLGIQEGSGAGKRDSTIQSSFRSRLLEKYESLDDTGEYAWCPILHKFIAKENTTAAHLFSYKHGQVSMDAIFGKQSSPELFSEKNGLIISTVIEKVLDTGVLVIVPDLPDKPTQKVLTRWLNQDIRDFKIRIIDREWSKLDHGIEEKDSGIKWRDLDNRKLKFIGKFRPAARYLYFHYCLQVLRRAWRAGPGQHAAFTLKDELGKPIWATPGRYIPRNMLLAFVEELGHEHSDLLIAASRRRGRPNILLDAAAAHIADKSESESESESEEDNGNESENYH
ncbi:hypothetical protein DTO271D3_1046 [Paecilomyces variotii]|nr:hypothetical protein DTO271D3_1046 [Paecilomyces variotii]